MIGGSEKGKNQREGGEPQRAISSQGGQRPKVQSQQNKVLAPDVRSPTSSHAFDVLKDVKCPCVLSQLVCRSAQLIRA